ncbi:hypothetical protein [Paenibacillus lautus]|uniref:hypothetical protein n=1 Tax=Paenibacillus lautus TaxID=1401 RepID=UPI003D2D4FB9
MSEEIGRSKEHVERLTQLWSKHVGPDELVYLYPRWKGSIFDRRDIGQPLRARALSFIFVKKSERGSAWR